MKHNNDRKSEYETFLEKGDGIPSSELSLPENESFIRLLISFFTIYNYLGYPGIKDMFRMKSLARCQGVLKDAADDLGDDPDTIRQWLHRLKKTYQRRKGIAMRKKQVASTPHYR